MNWQINLMIITVCMFISVGTGKFQWIRRLDEQSGGRVIVITLLTSVQNRYVVERNPCQPLS